MTARVLEDDLRHVERSARAAGQRLVVEPARCLDCGFAFGGRTTRGRDAAGDPRRRFATPGRCPRCRGERIGDVQLRLEARGAGRHGEEEG